MVQSLPHCSLQTDRQSVRQLDAMVTSLGSKTGSMTDVSSFPEHLLAPPPDNCCLVPPSNLVPPVPPSNLITLVTTSTLITLFTTSNLVTTVTASNLATHSNLGSLDTPSTGTHRQTQW